MNYDAFLESLAVMGQGMAGIFIVTAIIVIAITILSKFSKEEKQ